MYFELPANGTVLKIAIEKDLECIEGALEERDPEAFPRGSGKIADEALRQSLLLIALTMAPRFGRAQDAKTPDALEIIKKSVAATALDWRAQPEYSFREHDSKSKVNSSGEVKAEQSKTYEVKMIEGSPYYRLVAINNEALPPRARATRAE